jgi:hypothetical protein
MNAASSAAAAAASKPAAVTGIPITSAASAPDVFAALKPITPDAVANGFATLLGALVGALAGAMLAYFFQRMFQRRQDHRAALLSAHRMMFALLQQMNTILLIQRDYVFEHLSHPARFFMIPPRPPMTQPRTCWTGRSSIF